MAVLAWFEIPAVDLERAVAFYNAILAIELQQIPETKMYAFPVPDMSKDLSGAVVYEENHKPSQDGALLYLSAEGQLDAVLSRVEAAGGSIVLPRTDISPFGFMAYIIDSEGNRIGLQSNS